MPDQDESTTIVVFRVWRKNPQKGQVIALFPEIQETPTTCSSYMHVGQHGDADYTGVITATRPATPEEYAPLKRELESEPYKYKLKAVARRPKWRK